VARLIEADRGLLKKVQWALDDKIPARKLSGRERKKLIAELENVNLQKLDKTVQGYDLRQLAKTSPESLAVIYNSFYEEGKKLARLKTKLTTNKSLEKLKKHKEYQDIWEPSPEEVADIKVNMNK
jgi:hypothetical protein